MYSWVISAEIIPQTFSPAQAQGWDFMVSAYFWLDLYACLHVERVLVQSEAHIVVFCSSLPIFLCPPSAFLSLCFCSFTLPPPLFKLPYTPFSLFAGQEEMNNMTFSRSDNILPHEFPTAPAFISHSHQFVFAPGSSVFPRNDHPGTRWLTSSTRGQGASRASAGSHIGKPHRR